MNERRVLVVEDERIVARDLQLTLQRLGYDCPEVAGSSAEALRTASEHCPDLVLMDIHLPGDLDGIECARALRDGFDVPVVFLTAYSDADTLSRAASVGPHGYLVKPVRTDELRTTIEVSLYKHQMDRRLKERERWFATTLQSISDAVISTDARGHIAFMNPVAESLTGWRSEEADGLPIEQVLQLLDSGGKVTTISPIQEALGRGRSVEITGTLVPRAGAQRKIVDTTAPIVDGGATVGAVVVFRDITEEHKAQRRMQLTDRLASLATLAGGMAHGINNPLAVVLISLELARGTLSEADPEQARTWMKEVDGLLEGAVDGVTRIKRIVHELGMFAGRSEPGIADVERSVGWAAKVISPALDASNAMLSRIGTPVPKVALEETRLAQVLLQLLSNAVQAVQTVPPERRKIELDHRLREDGRVELRVTDQGVGIPPELLSRIFDPFYTTKAVGQGTGLGLAIVHGIIGSAEGELTVESVLGEGTTFRVVLPAAPPGDVVGTPPEARAKILIVDEEALSLNAMRRFLSDTHEVVTASSSLEAQQRLQTGEHFDVIVADLMMARHSSREFYEWVLAHRPEQARQMLFVAAGATTVGAIEFLRSIPEPYLEKPISAQDLRARVQELLAKRFFGVKDGS
ncbi:MAG: response regulator [Deltaproteobacteria bacterium]|nr:response regulator [Deltaproteobacteria bacterium]